MNEEACNLAYESGIQPESLRPSLFGRAVGRAILLSFYFMVVYNGCNWLASRRSHVGTLYFDWERRIPFVPILIFPYMSIDLFFFFSPLLCRDVRRARTPGGFSSRSHWPASASLSSRCKWEPVGRPSAAFAECCSRCSADSTNPTTSSLPCTSPCSAFYGLSTVAIHTASFRAR